jgi:hypothetical protein
MGWLGTALLDPTASFLGGFDGGAPVEGFERLARIVFIG